MSISLEQAIIESPHMDAELLAEFHSTQAEIDFLASEDCKLIRKGKMFLSEDSPFWYLVRWDIHANNNKDSEDELENGF